MSDTPNFQQLVYSFKKIYDRLPAVAGAIAVRRAKKNFQNQGWTDDETPIKWDERSTKDKSKKRRAILIRKRHLSRSPRIIRKGAGYVKMGSTLPYSKIHNEGGTIKGIAKVPQHKRRAHKRSIPGKKRKKQQVAEATVKAHTRKMNTKMPKRQFIGENKGTLKEIDAHIKKEIDKATRKWASK